MSWSVSLEKEVGWLSSLRIYRGINRRTDTPYVRVTRWRSSKYHTWQSVFLQSNMSLFVTLVTEVSLISREPNLRFERISISRRFLWKSFSSFPFYTLQKRTRHGLSETSKFRTAPFVWLCQTLYCETHTFRIINYIKRFDFRPCTFEKGLLQSKIFWHKFCLFPHLFDGSREE